MLHVINLREGLPVFKSLASSTRIAILEMLYEKGTMSMTEIAEALQITGGALTPHIKMLADTGFLTVAFTSGKHGIQRACSAAEQRVLIDPAHATRNINVYETEIGVGQYSNYEAFPTCGLATPERLIGEVDDPRYFASPERVNASILWLGHGFVEYLLPNFLKPNQQAVELQISMELASEAPGSSDDWPSDITFSLNGVTLCTWTSPGDFGRTRGIYNPAWWDRNWNQYGLFKLLSVNQVGTFIDGGKRSDVTLEDINIRHATNLVLRIGAPKDTENAGGLTIFGRRFGNYDQDIRIRMQYR
ncbi:MAG: helix-turn-helix domain-containing protein [Clostridia bacterium]|nr:helix-turn-helix domain-containing protein [Clostridia bacterium]